MRFNFLVHDADGEQLHELPSVELVIIAGSAAADFVRCQQPLGVMRPSASGFSFQNAGSRLWMLASSLAATFAALAVAFAVLALALAALALALAVLALAFAMALAALMDWLAFWF